MTNRIEPEQPTGDELVVQIQQSDQSNFGPNETLRRDIEMFSKSGPVFRSLAETLVGAMFVPMFLAFVAFQLSPYIELTSLRGSVARGLWTLCPPLFACLFLARALRSDGLAERYFNWSPELCAGLARSVFVMVWIWLPLRFFYTSLETFDGSTEADAAFPGQWSDSLGRILFIVAMLAFSFGLWSTARSLRRWMFGLDRPVRMRNAFQSLMLWFLPLLPAMLAAMSVLGYHFTAIEMSRRMMWTVILMIGISMTGGLISRLMLIAQFGIKLRQLSRNDDGEIIHGESIDIGAITAQVNRLLRATALVAMVVVGWQFFADVLPVINYLDDVHLPWSFTDADGVKSPISLRHLLLAISIGVITLVLSRNLPGLLEITLLDRLPLDRGGRYAITFVVRYLVAIVGLIIAGQMVGITGTSIKWSVAGLTIGLGFGLQEIFSNVISGLIILIERPIRLGDVVTVNNVTGTVTRMQLRATTIKDLDFRELIVPNKRFITEDIMNWTLTDRRSRIVVQVGVAYGSNTKLVSDSLLKVAARHPLVQSQPQPDVFFKEFGDSTLNFELRVFIPSREIFAQVQHELNMAIEAEFKAKDIEIAFPQQDIYIKNLSEMPVPGPNPVSGGPGNGRSPFTRMPSSNSPGQGRGRRTRGSTSAKHEDMVQDLTADLDIESTAGIPIDGDQSLQNQPQDLPRVAPVPLKQMRGKNNGVLSPNPKKSA